MKKIYLLFLMLYVALSEAQNYSPLCTGYFYGINSTTPQVSNTGAPNTASAAPFVLPASANGLAVGPAFGFVAPNPTFWTFSNDTLCYLTGTVFVRSGHRFTNNSARNIGGSANFIYGLDASTGQVYKYNGSGDAAFLTTVPSYTNGGLAEDIAGDELDNFYVLDLRAPQSLQVFNSSGTPVCSYSLSGIPTSTKVAESFAISGNTVNVQRGTEYFIGVISGTAVSFTQTAHTLNPPLDFASCPVSYSFTSTISSAAGPCLNSTLSLNAVSSIGPVSYTWSGPGIAGSVSNQTVLINLPGVYSCSLQSAGCLPRASVCSYTVFAVPTLTAVAVTPTICFGSPATFSASGAVSYTWTPGNYVGQSVMIPLPFTSPTVKGTSADGCTATAVADLTVQGTPGISLTSSVYTLCPATVYTLWASAGAMYKWSPTSFPSSLPFNTYIAPIVTTPSVAVHTVTAILGPCSSTAAVTVTFYPAPPPLTIQANPPVVCAGNSTTLTVLGANTYTWELFFQGSTFIASPVNASTTYNVMGTNIYGCTKSANISIGVSQVYVNMTSSPPGFQVCSGNPVVLTQVSTLNSYTWSSGGATSSSIQVTPSVTTVYTIAGTNTLGCPGSSSGTLFVTPTPTVTSNLSNTTICQTGSVVLTAGGASGYTWEPGMQTGSVITILSPQATNLYTITAANGTCMAKNYVNVIVEPNPSLVVSNHQSTVCSGNSTTLTVSGADTFTWAPLGSNSTTMMITPVLPLEIYTVSGTFTNSGCSSIFYPVVHVTPTPTLTGSANPATVCPGGTSTLSVLGAASYTWTQPVAFTNTCLVTPLVNSIYTVVGKSGICTSSLTVNVPVYPVPTLAVNGGNSVNVCSGANATLTANGAVSYTWQPGNIQAGTLTVVPASSSIYTLSGTNAESCKSETLINVYVLNNPVITAYSTKSLVCEGESVKLYAIGAVSYTWSGNIKGGTVTVIPNTLPVTSYTLSGTGQNGCLSNIASVTVDVQKCEGINDHYDSENVPVVYPNPGYGLFTVKLNSISEKTVIEVYNTLGALVAVHKTEGLLTHFDLHDQPGGIYLVVIKEKSGKTAQVRWIKE